MTGFGEAGHTGEIFHRSAPVARRAREGSSSADGVDLRFAEIFGKMMEVTHFNSFQTDID